MRALIAILCGLLMGLALPLEAQETAPSTISESQPTTQPAPPEPVPPTPLPPPTPAPPVKPNPEKVKRPSETQPKKSSHEKQVTPETLPLHSGEMKGIDFLEGEGCHLEPAAGIDKSSYTLRISFLEGGEESVCDVTLKVQTVKGKSVFESPVKSAWIYLHLPPGGYIVSAKRPDGTKKRVTTQTAEGKIQQARVFFQSP